MLHFGPHNNPSVPNIYVPVYLGAGVMQVKIQLSQCLSISVPLTEARRRKIALDSNDDCRRASSRGLIPKAKVKTIKMTFVIVFGEYRITRVSSVKRHFVLINKICFFKC